MSEPSRNLLTLQPPKFNLETHFFYHFVVIIYLLKLYRTVDLLKNMQLVELSLSLQIQFSQHI